MSSFVTEILARLFPADTITVVNPGQIYLSEPLVRSDKFLETYRFWMARRENKSLDQVRDEVHKLLHRMPVALLSFHSFLGGSGLVIDTGSWNLQEAEMVFEHIKQRILTETYEVHRAIRRYYDFPATVETRQLYYLKPAYAFTEDGLRIQKYGNLSIELVTDRLKPHCIKLQQGFYLDRNFAVVLPFEQLLSKIFFDPV